MRNLSIVSLLFGFLSAVATTAHAQQENQGWVGLSEVDGTARIIQNDGRSLRARSGMQLAAGATLRTQEDGNVRLVLSNGAVLGLRPDSELLVETLRHDLSRPAEPSAAEQGASSTRLALQQGAIAGFIQPLNMQHSSFSLSTPVGQAAVRGPGEALFQVHARQIEGVWVAGFSVGSDGRLIVEIPRNVAETARVVELGVRQSVSLTAERDAYGNVDILDLEEETTSADVAGTLSKLASEALLDAGVAEWLDTGVEGGTLKPMEDADEPAATTDNAERSSLPQAPAVVPATAPQPTAPQEVPDVFSYTLVPGYPDPAPGGGENPRF